MNFAAMKTRATALISFGGYPDSSPALDMGSLLNEAYLKWAWQTEYNLATGTFQTGAGAAEYPLPGPAWKELSEVVYAGTRALRLSDEAQEQRRNPLWLVETAAQPSRFLLTGANTLRLAPLPSTGNDTVTFRGIQAPAPLVSDAESPTFSEQWHIALCYKAAELWLEGFATKDEVARTVTYATKYSNYVEECRTWMRTKNEPLTRTVLPTRSCRVRL